MCNKIRSLKVSSLGFTLVELAIVMVIIGLLIGGILKGQTLIQEAKFKKTVSMVSGFQAAAETFKDKYSAIPGDMLGASARIQNCNAECNLGDGDGIVGILNAQAQDDQTGTSLPLIETTLFWRHLALADLITGVDTLSLASVPEAAFTHPAGSMGGAFSVYHRQGRHGLSLKACPNSSVCGTGILTAEEALRFDTLIDGGGDARNGTVMASGPPGCNYTTGVYTPSDPTPSCYILFDIRF